MISVDEARKVILAQMQVMGLEKVDLLSSLGRVLGEKIMAPENIPPWDNSAMDGYAVRFDDIQAATPTSPVRLKVIADLPAGAQPTDPVRPGEAIRIMTGAPIPEGADTVVRVEDTSCAEGIVEIFLAPDRGGSIRRAGENVQKGEQTLSPGAVLRPPHLGLLASFSRNYISVYQVPRVAVLSTGDELTEIDGEKALFKIVNSNTYAISAQVKECGALPVMLGIARDDKHHLAEKLRQSLAADVIITTAGVSMGEYDYVRIVLEEIGTEIKFWRVAMRPGKPLTFGLVGGKPVFGLPGNPVSCMISFEQFVRPALLKIMGHTYLDRPQVEAILTEDIKVGGNVRHFVRVRLHFRNGQVCATTTGEQGSGILKSMVHANGLMIVPEDRETVQAGEKLKVQVLDPTFELGGSDLS